MQARFTAKLIAVVVAFGALIPAAGAKAATDTVAGLTEGLTEASPHTTVSDDGQVFDVSTEIAGLPGGGLESFVGTAPQPESVIGSDSRYRIYGTTSFPYRAVVQIAYWGSNGCTGWMVGKDTVMTAGHCVYNKDTNRWFSGVTVSPGQNGSSKPYGTCSARRLYSVTGWTVDENRNYDYGAIKLNCTVGYSTGWFGHFWQTASLTGTYESVVGYPGDKPDGTMWKGNGYIRISQTYRLYYDNDTFNGNSGGPVYHYRGSGSSYCTGYCSMAIHAYGVDGTGYNGGTRIRQAVSNNLKAWRDAA